jgi:hypothetical protein
MNSACHFLLQIKSVCWREGICILVVGGACVHFIGAVPFSVPKEMICGGGSVPRSPESGGWWPSRYPPAKCQSSPTPMIRGIRHKQPHDDSRGLWSGPLVLWRAALFSLSSWSKVLDWANSIAGKTTEAGPASRAAALPRSLHPRGGRWQRTWRLRQTYGSIRISWHTPCGKHGGKQYSYM